MSQKELAKKFADLHVKGEPLVLFNVWDAGTAKAVEEIGARAVATGSWAVAAANGFADGEKIPFDSVCGNLERITASVELPVTLDAEGGYAPDPERLGENTRKILAAGAVGINFEDQIVAGSGIYSIDEQCSRIRAIRKAADELSVPLFINARTDIFLHLKTAEHTEDHLAEAIERAAAYADAGASGFFAPALVKPEFIGSLCERSAIPVNILVWPGVPTSRELADLGVARISYGSGSYRIALEAFKAAGRRALSEATVASSPATGRQ